MRISNRFGLAGRGVAQGDESVEPEIASNVARSIEELLRPVPGLGLPVPAYEGRSLPNVTSSALMATGQVTGGEPPLLPPLASELDPFQGRPAEGPVVVFLVDGLGWNAFEEAVRTADSAVPGSWIERARPLTSVFPTTTTVALTSLSTAESPGRHGIVGHRMYLPAFGAVTEILRMSPLGVSSGEALAGPEWGPSVVSGVPTVFRRGATGNALTRDRYEKEAFTRLIYDGASFQGYATAADLAHQLSEVLGRADPPPIVMAYWDELDLVQHLRGPRTEFSGFEIGQVARILAVASRRLGPSRSRRLTVLITSDHGQVPADRPSEVAIDRHPEILAHLQHPPGGDRRAAFFAARPGEGAALEDALARRLPMGHRIVRREVALAAGLFGPPPFHPEIGPRLGDLLALVPSPAGITYRVPGAAPRTRYLPGAHGGLEPPELLVPLIAGPLSELAEPRPGRS